MSHLLIVLSSEVPATPVSEWSIWLQISRSLSILLIQVEAISFEIGAILAAYYSQIVLPVNDSDNTTARTAENNSKLYLSLSLEPESP